MAKQTVGDKLLHKLEADGGTPAQELIETSDEIGRDFLKRVDDIIAKHRDYADVYWIVLYAKPVVNLPYATFTKIVVRKTAPTNIEGWASIVYRYDNTQSCLYFEGVTHLNQSILLPIAQ